MADFVLVHGAWHGGWCWQRVASRLESAGHRTFAPTLRGLVRGDDTEGVRLRTHIGQIVDLLEAEDLTGVVLVGHSYGGFVISGVAEKTTRIASIVFLDAFLPDDGQCMLDLGTDRGREGTKAALARGESALPSLSAEFFGVNEADRAWVDEMCAPHPIGTFTERVHLTGARERITRKTYIRALRYTNEGLAAAAARVRRDKGWRLIELDTAHDVMIDMPGHLAEILLEIERR